MQLMGEHSSAIVSAHWAIVDWSVAYKSGTGMHELTSTKKKKKEEAQAGNDSMNPLLKS